MKMEEEEVVTTNEEIIEGDAELVRTEPEYNEDEMVVEGDE